MRAAMRSRGLLALLSLALLPVAPAALLSPSPATGKPPNDRAVATSTVLDWQLTALRTVYVEGAQGIPPGTLYLGFTSLAVHRAATKAVVRVNTSATAAVATAAHDVLLHYFPGSRANLDADLATSLAAVPDGDSQGNGARLGHRVVARQIASRGDEVLGDPQVTYELDGTKVGVWAPPPTGMAFAWLGYVKPLVLDQAVPIDGPDPLTSADYTADFNEVKTFGTKVASGTPEDIEHKAVADFFFANSVIAYERALVTYLRTNPIGLTRTSRMFAVMNASMADALREIWRLKREIGFWRPFQAIARAEEDGNPGTVADAGWAPYKATPPYSEYPSGHAGVTGTFAQTVRVFLGEHVPLTLVSVPSAPLPSRSYATLTALEHDAFMARIWAGIHFRDAMDDGYYLAHRTARRVADSLD